MPAEVTQDELKDESGAAAPSGGAPAQDKPAGEPAAGAAPEKGGEEGKGESAAPKNALEAAQRVMAKEGKVASDKPQDQKQPDAKVGDDKPKEGESKPGDEDADVPANVKSHPKYRQLSEDLKVERRANRINKDALAKMEPHAKVGENLSQFINSYGFTQDEFAQGLVIMAATKNDPRKAYELLAPLVDGLRARVGLVLPDDLQRDVEAGTISQERAQELSRARASSALDRERAAATEARLQREAQERAQGDEDRAFVNITQALDAAEAEWLKTDPDAEKLKPMVQDIVLVDSRDKPPTTPEEARALYVASVQKAKQRVAGFVPSPRPKTGVLPAGANPANVTQVPKSALEAATMAVQRMRG